MREEAEGVAIGHQTVGEMSRCPQAGSGERREEDVDGEEQSAAGVTRGASTCTAEEAETAARIRGRRGESQSCEEIMGQSEVAKLIAEWIAEQLASFASRPTLRGEDQLVRELRVLAEECQRVESGEPEGIAQGPLARIHEVEAGSDQDAISEIN